MMRIRSGVDNELWNRITTTVLFRILTVTTALILVFASSLVSPASVWASDYVGDDVPRGTSITIVVPNHHVDQGHNQNQNQGSQPRLPMVYPVSVWETRDSGRREIIRVYELRENESSEQIPREPFERDGFRFELAEIVRREVPAHSSREHVEIIEVSTQSNDLESIIRLLAPTLDFVTEDGYFGVLTLDVSSIRIESQGTTSSSFTETRTREFPHLSNSDTSLVPRSITENGQTFELADVQWRTQTSNAIDFTQVPNTFTAVATYTRTSSRTSTIGYTTTAEYRGQISRVAAGRTEFTAQFIGIPIVSPITSTGQSSDGQHASDGDSAAVADGMAVGGVVAGESDGVVSATAPAATSSTIDRTLPPTPAPNIGPASSSEPTTIENVNVEQVHIGGIVIEVEREPLVFDDVNEDGENGSAYVNDDDSSENNDVYGVLPIGNIAIGILFIGGIVLAYFVGKKGKAILGSLRKASCFLMIVSICTGFALADDNAVNASPLPSYNFGAQGTNGNVQSVGLSSLPQGNTQVGPQSGLHSSSHAAAHSAPAQTNVGANAGISTHLNPIASDRAIHFDPRVASSGGARDSPIGNPRDSPVHHIDSMTATHFDPSVTAIHFNPSGAAIHFNPSGAAIHFAHGISSHHNYSYGDFIGVLTVERLGRRINVIAGATMGAMDFGAGHFSFSGLNYGNTALIGHNRGRTNGFFSFVRELREGDILTLEAGGIIRSYAVSMVYTVDESDFSPLMQFGDHRLTLVTCVEYVPGQRRIAKALAIFP